ncbi:hypothetical protein ACLOJK_001187 [Asimina triloba]
MANSVISLSMLLAFLLFLSHASSATSETSGGRRTYIIHMEKSSKPATFDTHHSWYTSLISSLSEDGGIPASHLYTYNHVMDGFSAVLSPGQLEKLESMPGHLATYPETYGKLHTTRSPKFLGLNRHDGLWPTSHFGDDMIIGIIDSGIWPENEMFNDRGMPPVPARWQGACETGDAFNTSNCNRKLIGARSFSKGLKERGINISKINDYDSPRDFFGHGTHTASTAAGSRTPGVNYFGYAKGTASGVAPRARVAMYKIGFSTDTEESMATDVLAGMDQAIADGVDLMSLSLAFPEQPYHQNVISLGAFAAMENGIFVSCSAGNSGPHAYTIINGAPWITTVGAGTIDRDYGALITLGDGATTIQGKSIFPENIYISRVPLYYGHGNASKENCSALDAKEISGKIVFCSFANVLSQIYRLSSENITGAIVATDSAEFLDPSKFSFPLVAVSIKQGEIIKNYIANASTNISHLPTVDITFQLTVLGAKPAPKVAFFSSRGPNKVSPWILKPDVIAPGYNILAGWASNSPIQPIGRSAKLLSDFALISGTSMSSPHVVGVAALLRAAHPEWSPAAVRSALMTTASLTDNTHGPILDMETGAAATPLDYGAGHVDPNKAMDPGLVYDIEYQDYVNFLCGLNYTSGQIKIITRKSSYTCTKASVDLNYPSFIIILNNKTNSASVVFNRALTNVVDSPSVYHAVVKAPTGMRVEVEPAELKFDAKNSKQAFTVTVEVDMVAVIATSEYIGNFGYLTWHEKGGRHVVRSPIVSAFGP